VLRRCVGRAGLHVPLLLFRTNRNHDLVRRKRRKSVVNGKPDIRLAGRRLDGLARKLICRAFGNPLRTPEGFLVIGEPIEHALPHNRYHNLDGFGVPDMPAQNVVGMFDGADDKHVPAHDGTDALGAPSAPARNDVDESDESNDDHRSHGDDGDRGRGEDHTTFLHLPSSRETFGLTNPPVVTARTQSKVSALVTT
jgi:hypothetical protein